MIGMDFVSFLILLVISVVVSYVLHFILKYYIIPGWWSYFSKVGIGWVGAWLGSPVFGYWWLNYLFKTSRTLRLKASSVKGFWM
jgi:hypothetical protein